MREPRTFSLGVGRSWPRWWLVASVLVHFVVLTALVESSMSWQIAHAGRELAAAQSRAELGGANRQIVFYLPATPAARRHGEGGGAVPARAAGVPVAAAPAPAVPLVVDTGRAATRIGAGGRDTMSVASTGSNAARGALGVLAYTPALGDGRVWVGPLTGQEDDHSPPIRLDSAVAIRMRAMADSIEKHPLPDVNANPYVSRPWTFRVGGKLYGIDSKGLHLGSITIPTAVLAFLSMPQGNIDEARANQALMQMRADILRAAARAQTEEDFKKAVKEIRERKEKEHEEQQQQQQQGNPQPAQP